MNIKPIKSKVLIAQNKSEIKTESGLILDSASSARDSYTGTVLAVGPDVKEVKVDDVVYLDWSKGQVTKINEVQRVLIEEEHIVAVLEK